MKWQQIADDDSLTIHTSQEATISVLVKELGLEDANSVRPPYRSGCPVDKIQPDLEGLIHMPPSPRPEVLYNPIWVGLRWMISARCVGRAAVCTSRARQSAISR